MRKPKTADLLEVSGSVLIVTGVAMWSAAAAIVIAGAGCLFASWRRS